MKKVTNLSLILMLIFTTVTIVSCNDDDDMMTDDDMNTELSLYEKLGGFEMVQDPADPSKQIEQGRLSYRAVVDSAIGLIVADIAAEEPGNLGEHFAPILVEVNAGNTTNLALLSKNLTDFFAANTGGESTNTYNGLGMVEAHDPAQNPRMGKKSTDADYDKFIGYVGEAAGLNGVTDTEIINEVVAVLESLRDPIVQE